MPVSTLQDVKPQDVLFRELFNNMSSGVAIYAAVDGGKDFVFKEVNEAGQKISQIDITKFRGKRVTKMFPAVEEMGLLDVFRRVYKTGKPAEHPVQLYEDERIKQWVRNYVYKLPSGEIVAVYDDLTSEKEAERKLHENKERLELALKGTSDGVWDWNIVTNEVYYSDRWKGMLGYAPDEIKNDFSEWETRLHPDDRGESVKYVQDYVKSGGVEAFEMEFRMRHKDGHYVDILGRAFMVKGASGKPVRMVGTHIDNTERIKAKKELEKKVSELEQVNKLMVGRELKMVELKKEVTRLKTELP